ncbi:MAG: mevalonate kinase [Nitrosopumilus sp. H8]|nr:MAG: mevalonate kinase [Nitrosopumilus sp. H13]RNJ78672.1 MAG: mevalonate kinase [Nitrosopumilus sp. H8]
MRQRWQKKPTSDSGLKSTASAPGKVILFGEHFVVYGSGAILCAINRRITVSAEAITEKKIRITSDVGSLDMEPGIPACDVGSSLRSLYHIADTALRSHGIPGIKMAVKSDIPAGVGLGSSSACCVAGAAAVSGLFPDSSREKILELAVDAERTAFQGTSGADCTVCTYGGIIRYGAKSHEKIEPGPGFGLAVASSGTTHSTESVVARVKKFRDANPAEFSRMCDAESEIIRSAKGQIEQGETAELGRMINQNQQYLEAIGVSNQTLQEMVRIGQGAAAGAKITGAGGGGCVFALTDGGTGAADAFREGGYECFAAGIDCDGLIVFN